MIILMQTVKLGKPTISIPPLNPSFKANLPPQGSRYKHEDSPDIETSSRVHEAIEAAQASSSKGAARVRSLKFVEEISVATTNGTYPHPCGLTDVWIPASRLRSDKPCGNDFERGEALHPEATSRGRGGIQVAFPFKAFPIKPS
jgi:hypothetical protein